MSVVKKELKHDDVTRKNIKYQKFFAGLCALDNNKINDTIIKMQIENDDVNVVVMVFLCGARAFDYSSLQRV